MTSNFKEVKLELLTDNDMLLMIKKVIWRAIRHAVHWYAKINNKYVKDYDRKKESSYFKYWDVNNLYSWTMLQKIPVNKFEWIEYTTLFNKDFIKSYNEKSNERYFLKLMFNILRNYRNFVMICHFYLKGCNLKRSKRLLLTYMIKLNILTCKTFKASIKSQINFEKVS